MNIAFILCYDAAHVRNLKFFDNLGLKKPKNFKKNPFLGVQKMKKKTKDCFVTESSGCPAKLFHIVFPSMFSLCIKEYAHARVFKIFNFFTYFLIKI